MTGADRGVSQRGGCRWLGFTFGLRTVVVGTPTNEGWRGEGERERGVLRWDIGEWFHACIPRTLSNQGGRERYAGPIWNNRIPFAIVFLSASLSPSLFLVRRDGYKRIGYPVRTRVVTDTRIRCAWRRCAAATTKLEKQRGRETADGTRTPSRLVTRYTYGSVRAIILSAHRHGSPAALCGPHTHSPRALYYFFDSSGKRVPPRR